MGPEPGTRVPRIVRSLIVANTRSSGAAHWDSMNRTLRGVLAALATMVPLALVLLAVRDHLSVATIALVMVVPVVVGVVVGGFGAGMISVVAGFVVYDSLFIQPYGTLNVGAAQNWVALLVYVVVTLPVARLVAGLDSARAEANRQRAEVRRLFELSDLLVEDRPIDTLLPAVVATLAETFDAPRVALFLTGRPDDPVTGATGGVTTSRTQGLTASRTPGVAASRSQGVAANRAEGIPTDEPGEAPTPETEAMPSTGPDLGDSSGGRALDEGPILTGAAGQGEGHAEAVGQLRGLYLAAYHGAPPTPEETAKISPAAGSLGRVGANPDRPGDFYVIALASSGRVEGLLAISGESIARQDREPLLVFANHVALAVERSELQEQALRARVSEQISRLATTLVSAVSHDLRTPLASIKASSSLLSDPSIDLPEQERERLAALIDSRADRLSLMVGDLLSMSRIRAGVLTPAVAPTNLQHLVESTVADFGFEEARHPVVLDLPHDLPPVAVDQALIARVIANLVENAERYAPPETAVTVSARVIERDGSSAVEVSVTDQGPGIPPAQTEEIFEMFSRRPGDKGIGLGLAISRMFVEAHGERITAGAGPSGGAVLRFTLPVIDTSPAHPR